MVLGFRVSSLGFRDECCFGFRVKFKVRGALANVHKGVDGVEVVLGCRVSSFRCCSMLQ